MRHPRQLRHPLSTPFPPRALARRGRKKPAAVAAVAAVVGTRRGLGRGNLPSPRVPEASCERRALELVKRELGATEARI